MNSEMDTNDWNELRALRDAPELFERIAQAAGGSELQLQRELRSDYPASLVRRAMRIADWRRKATAKFPAPQQMWFDGVALEQATAAPVAAHKAARFFEAGVKHVIDLCSGIGSDALALAAHCYVIAVDALPARCLMTGWNADALSVRDRIQPVCADVETLSIQSQFVHIDPDQRDKHNRRTRRVELARPALPFLHQLIANSKGGAIKLSPAANFGGNFENVEFELISLDGECKECTVWFGELCEPGLWRATVLPAGETLAGDPLSAMPDISPLRRFLYEPDPAIVRAGLVDLLADRFELSRLDDEEEYLTGDAVIDSPFVTGFEIRDELPNNERGLRRYFRERDFGTVEIKCRRIPVKVDDVRRKLPLDGNDPVTVLFARIAGKARIVIADRVG